MASQSSQESASQQTPFQTQLPYLADLYGRTGSLIDKDMVAGIDPLQAKGGEMIVDAAGNLSPYISGAQGASSRLFSGEFMDPSSNPYLAKSAQAAINPIFEQLTETALPSIRGDAGLTGNVGSSRQGLAEGTAIGKATQAAGDITSGMYSDAYGQGLNAMVQGLSMAPQIADLSFMPGRAISDVGTARRDIEQQKLLGPLQNLLAYAQILGDPKFLTESYGSGQSMSVNPPAPAPV